MVLAELRVGRRARLRVSLAVTLPSEEEVRPIPSKGGETLEAVHVLDEEHMRELERDERERAIGVESHLDREVTHADRAGTRPRDPLPVGNDEVRFRGRRTRPATGHMLGPLGGGDVRRRLRVVLPAETGHAAVAVETAKDYMKRKHNGTMPRP